MRIVFLLFLLSVCASGIQAQAFYGSTELKVFRDGRDEEFRDKKLSPLKDDDFAAFKGLNYYPVDKGFRVTATFTRTPSEKWFQMPTSSGTTKKYVKFGILEFELNQKPFVLSVYRMDPAIAAKFPEYADLLFVPFRDMTNRTETYGGGRYIDIKTPKDKTVTLDFNLAYNPSCAYGGEKWNCPIPPSENTLKLAVTAGEKRFAYSGSAKTH
ncbi:MAG: DUF1684 domain-containing protein [Pyrinomonadaceae bacterium]